MCAINGLTGDHKDLVARMNSRIAYRGPDATAVWGDGRMTLGFNRLAIIDLSERAMQPMTTPDGRYTLVFNGEIYNYRELKKELTGYHFTSDGDSEVILAAYATWGERALARLNGMFGLALWDSAEGKLIIARDPAGIKPLYYSWDGAALAFSSELRGLLEALPNRTIDTTALYHYMRLLYVPRGMTLIKGVNQLYPGEMLVYQNGAVSSTIFSKGWPEEVAPPSYAVGVESVRARVQHAVERQLVGDRPVGIYLSGGIDSTILLAAASKVHPSIDTFSVGFALSEGEESEKFNDDARLAAETAKIFGSKHHTYDLRADDVSKLFGQMIAHMSNPVGNATALVQLFLAQQTKSTATVVLSGDGGDELFGGYDRYRLALRAASLAPFVPRFLDKYLPGSLKSLHLNGVDRYAQLMFHEHEEWYPPLAGLPVAETKSLVIGMFKSADIADALMRTDEQNWLVDEALARTDTMGMAASIEVRVPFLDLEVAALAHALPRVWKVTTGATKRILKEAFKDVIPTHIINQPKRGWFAPGAKWLRRPEFVTLSDEILSDGYTDVSLLFNLQQIRSDLVSHREKRSYHYPDIWAVIVLLAWCKEYEISL